MRTLPCADSGSLWERGLVNRWAFPGIRAHSEFHYYLDNREALNLLVEHGGPAELHPQMLEEIRNNREKNYADAAFREQHMQLGFLQHSLMVSRVHFMLELACRTSDGTVELTTWRQGSQLAGRKLELPKIRSSRQGNDYFWEEGDEAQSLPLEPDALFSLRFHHGREEPRLAHFFYEADRGTMIMSDMLKKFRVYYHLIKRQQKHRVRLSPGVRQPVKTLVTVRWKTLDRQHNCTAYWEPAGEAEAVPAGEQTAEE